MYSFDLLAMVQNASFTVRKISLKFLTTFLDQLCELSIYKIFRPQGKEGEVFRGFPREDDRLPV